MRIRQPHTCSTLEKAEKVFADDVRICQENFPGRDGEFLIDIWGCREWRTEDGYGYTVSIEEIKPV